jgi:putative transposase
VTVRGWTAKIAPLITGQLRKKRFGKAGESCYVDETYIKVKGKWVYLYRSMDRGGNLVNTMLSETRDMEAAKRFFRGAKKVTGVKPDRVATDKHSSSPKAIATTLGTQHSESQPIIAFRNKNRKSFSSKWPDYIILCQAA